MNDPLRVAIVGCGIGEAHLQTYLQLPEEYEVVALCDVDVPRASRLAGQHGIAAVTGDVHDLYGMREVDVVDVCTPSYLHFRQSLDALAAGKDVICEKPAAGSPRELDELERAEALAGRRVMPVFQQRFGHGLQRLKYLVERGVAGSPYLATAETHWRREAAYYAGTWRGRWATELGGALVTLAIHALDVLCYVLGPAGRVSAETATLVNQIETEDSAVLALRMANGALCAASVTTGSALEITRHRFCFSTLSAESNSSAYENTSEPWIITGATPEAERDIAGTLAEFVPGPEGLAGQFERFYQAIRSGGPLPVTLADARNTIEMLAAVYWSAQHGSAVTLPLGPGHPAYGGFH